jgi:hypothetical protein
MMSANINRFVRISIPERSEISAISTRTLVLKWSSEAEEVSVVKIRFRKSAEFL